MKLREVIFDRYAGPDQQRKFDSRAFDIQLDVPRVGLIRIAPLGTPVEAFVVVAHNCDMYPEPDVPEAPARALPGKPRART